MKRRLMDSRLEDRYMVIKIQHLDYDQLIALYAALSEQGIRTVDCVVIEHDWPEYKPTVDLLMERVNGTP